jgi:segregation and condensation protein A
VEQTYQIKLPAFEGPFDLLLFFIERDELDIYDIPISRITEEFLQYIRHLETMNIDVASEFILVAATLMRIKAKMLIPRKELDESGQEIDPREELVARLVEYKKYKEVTESLRQMEEERWMMLKRGNIPGELKKIGEEFSTETDLQSLSLFRLMKSFQKVVERFEKEKNKPVHQITSFPYTIQLSKSQILVMVQHQTRIAFESVFDLCENRVHAIYHFLSILELVQERMLNITIGDGFNNFWISAEETTAE